MSEEIDDLEKKLSEVTEKKRAALVAFVSAPAPFRIMIEGDITCCDIEIASLEKQIAELKNKG